MKRTTLVCAALLAVLSSAAQAQSYGPSDPARADTTDPNSAPSARTIHHPQAARMHHRHSAWRHRASGWNGAGGYAFASGAGESYAATRPWGRAGAAWARTCISQAERDRQSRPVRCAARPIAATRPVPMQAVPMGTAKCGPTAEASPLASAEKEPGRRPGPFFILVPTPGLEPGRRLAPLRILSPMRLPIPPRRPALLLASRADAPKAPISPCRSCPTPRPRSRRSDR